MISKLYQNIAEALLKLYGDCPVYQEDVPQDFKTPGFLIMIYDLDKSSGINGREKTRLDVDVMYFPAAIPGNEARTECWAVAQRLNREFVISEYAMRGRKASIEDDTLHYMFEINYREYLSQEDCLMQKMYQNTEMEE